MIKTIFIIPISFVLMLSKCKNPKLEGENPGYYIQEFLLPYSINNPDTTYYLKNELREISGLAYSPINQSLLTINDEKAILYSINKENGRIIEKIDFGKNGDFEGITYHNGKIYIVESNGNVNIINEATRKKILDYDNMLSKGNNIEGIAYNQPSNSLLLAAKGDNRIRQHVKYEKAIFEMNDSTGLVSNAPFVSLNLSEIIKSLGPKHIADNKVVKLGINTRITDFAPSGIAIHPYTQDIYILSALGKLLVILDQNRKVKCVVFLDSQIHGQPEGICFEDNGTMYISNEGRGGKGYIHKYTPHLNLISSIKII